MTQWFESLWSDSVIRVTLIWRESLWYDSVIRVTLIWLSDSSHSDLTQWLESLWYDSVTRVTLIWFSHLSHSDMTQWFESLWYDSVIRVALIWLSDSSRSDMTQWFESFWSDSVIRVTLIWIPNHSACSGAGVWGSEVWGGGVSSGRSLPGQVHVPECRAQVSSAAAGMRLHVPSIQTAGIVSSERLQAVCLHRPRRHRPRDPGNVTWPAYSSHDPLLFLNLFNMQGIVGNISEQSVYASSLIFSALWPTFEGNINIRGNT